MEEIDLSKYKTRAAQARLKNLDMRLIGALRWYVIMNKPKVKMMTQRSLQTPVSPLFYWPVSLPQVDAKNRKGIVAYTPEDLPKEATNPELFMNKLVSYLLPYLKKARPDFLKDREVVRKTFNIPPNDMRAIMPEAPLLLQKFSHRYREILVLRTLQFCVGHVYPITCDDSGNCWFKIPVGNAKPVTGVYNGTFFLSSQPVTSPPWEKMVRGTQDFKAPLYQWPDLVKIHPVEKDPMLYRVLVLLNEGKRVSKFSDVPQHIQNLVGPLNIRLSSSHKILLARQIVHDINQYVLQGEKSVSDLSLPEWRIENEDRFFVERVKESLAAV